MYDCGLVRTEELYATAYGREALTADAPIYKTTGIVEDEDYAEALKNLPPVSEEATKIIYEKWTGYVKQLLDLVEIFASDNDIATIVDILMLYGKKDLTVLLHSPE
jgi:hypothetical protein